MKKAYIAPTVEAIKVNTTSILATSSIGMKDDIVDTSEEGVQQGREDRPSNPNLWDQLW